MEEDNKKEIKMVTEMKLNDVKNIVRTAYFLGQCGTYKMTYKQAAEQREAVVDLLTTPMEEILTK